MTENRTETAKRFLAKKLDKLSEQERQVVDKRRGMIFIEKVVSQPDHTSV